MVVQCMSMFMFFFFNDTATTEIYTLSLHDALPIYLDAVAGDAAIDEGPAEDLVDHRDAVDPTEEGSFQVPGQDRKSTRLNSSHANISYAVFCLKKKKIKTNRLVSTCIQHTLSPSLP